MVPPLCLLGGVLGGGLRSPSACRGGPSHAPSAAEFVLTARGLEHFIPTSGFGARVKNLSFPEVLTMAVVLVPRLSSWPPAGVFLLPSAAAERSLGPLRGSFRGLARPQSPLSNDRETAPQRYR